MNGYFQGFGRAFLKSFLVPCLLVILSLGIMTRMGLMNSSLSVEDLASQEGNWKAQATLYLLRVPGMRWLLLENGGEPTYRLEVASTSNGLAHSARPRLRPVPTGTQARTE